MVASSRTLTALRNQIRGSLKPAVALGTVREIVPEGELLEFVRWTGTVRRNGRPIFPGQYPTRISDLLGTPLLPSVSFRREFMWAGNVFQIHASKLQAFVALAKKFELSLVNGDYDTCLQTLDGIARQFGHSLWVIENRIATLQLSAGLEKQKNYAASIRASLQSANLVSFIAFYVSRRNEDSSTAFQFKNQFFKQVKVWALSPELETYLLYHITNEIPKAPENVARLLRYETSGAIIDYYETFIRLAQHAVIEKTDSLDIFLNVIQQLATHIPADHRLKKILFIGGAPGDWLAGLACRALSTDDAQAAGQHAEAARLCALSIGDDRLCVSNWFLEAEIVKRENSNGPPWSARDHAIDFARALFSQTDSTSSGIVNLNKMALNLRHMNFASALTDIVLRELSNNPVAPRTTKLLAFLDSPFLEPNFIRHLPTESAKKHLADCIIKQHGVTPATYMHVAIAGLAEVLRDVEKPALSDEVQTILLIESAFRRSDFNAALTNVRSYLGGDNFAFSRLVARYEALALIQLREFDELIEVVVTRSLQDAGLLRALPIELCATFLNKENRRRLASRLSTPIVLDFFSRNVDDRYDGFRSYAYEDFLIANGVERPSQLASRVDDFDQKQLVYYLRHICVPTVMQISSTFQRTREVEDERLAIASLLIKLDPDQTKVYETEIREIARNQLIQHGLRHVEQSKIFVDLVAIHRWADKNIKEAFERYQGLIKAGIGGEGAFVEAVKDFLSGSTPLPTEFLQLPKNEASDLLIQIIRILFRECLADPQHGLDCYLSMRIRHGTLSGQLRSPLELEKIITQRAAGSQAYTRNVYWLKQLSSCDPRERNHILDRLAKFSRDYDDFIERAANDLIRIRSVERPKGLFDVSISHIRFRLLASSIKVDTTFDNFLEICFQLFWECLGESLKTVREAIDSKLKPEVASLFLNLISDIEKLSNSPIPDLNRAIRTAQTGALQALNLVKDWFQLLQPQTEPEFSFEEMVDIGLQCVRKIHHEFDPKVTTTIPQLPRFAHSLTLFSDLFFIIFDNIRRHSGGLNRPDVELEVSWAANRLRIVVRNKVAKGVQTEDQVNRVAKIKQTIAGGEYLNVVSSEGGTGLIKLRKIIGDDPSKPRHLDFGFGDDGRFFVDLELPLREMAK
jgi:hypothetical protein